VGCNHYNPYPERSRQKKAGVIARAAAPLPVPNPCVLGDHAWNTDRLPKRNALPERLRSLCSRLDSRNLADFRRHLDHTLKDALASELAKGLTKIPNDKILDHLHGVLPI
jgi:hypothetical protein